MLGYLIATLILGAFLWRQWVVLRSRRYPRQRQERQPTDYFTKKD